MKLKRAVLWVAVSSLAQADDEQESLPEQTRRLEALAREKEWQVVDTITVPGHSRVYYNYREFAEAALDEGMTAPMRMFEHWKQRDFDVLACMSGDRFGREQSIFAEVVGRTVDNGAVVHTVRDGEINQSNKRMFVSMAGYQAAVEIDELRRRYRFGMNRRAEEGKPVASRIVFSHKALRNEIGHAQKLVVREELRPLFNDLARVLLDRTPWFNVETVLFEQYGHVAENGKPYPSRYFYSALRSPVFWGNNARGYAKHEPVQRRLFRAWIFDEGEPIPDDVLVFYNTHEPVYTGELAGAVKAEMRRRLSLRGSARPDSQYPFSGMFECGECKHKMAWTFGRGNYRSCRCNVAYGLLARTADTCTQRMHMKESYVYDYMREVCALLVSVDDVEALLNSMGGREQPPDETPLLEQQLKDMEEEGRILIQQQMKARGGMSKLYEEQVDLLTKRMEIVQTRLMLAQRSKPSVAELADQRNAVHDIQKLGEAFWEQPPGRINQLLRRALGRRLFVVREGKITHLKYVL